MLIVINLYEVLETMAYKNYVACWRVPFESGMLL